jgi:ubiquinone/menaquinone biosynthesis C-methylase UbiE
MKTETIGSKPIGLFGKLAGIVMNLIHARQYRELIQKYIIDKTNNVPMSILDIGCGGGKTINIFYSLLKTSNIYGIDHSFDMVNLSKIVNKKGILDGSIEIVQGDVQKIPYSNELFNIVTAFDTISFWDDVSISINEIKRVLKPDGIFVIVNGYPQPGTKWYEIVKFKTDDEYRSYLKKNGFNIIDIYIEKNTIIIMAQQ